MAGGSERLNVPGSDWHRSGRSHSRGAQQKPENNQFSDGPRKPSWRHRPKSPGLKWYKDYNEHNSQQGRVLVIDYVKQDLSKEGMRKVAAQEISNVEGLRKLYADKSRADEAILRLFHVQNADWAVSFLLKKFFIKADELVGSNFGHYVLHKTPERRGGKPVLKGKTWPTQHDPWRGIIKTAYGVDYLKLYECQTTREGKRDVVGKVMELNCYDEATESPKYGYDVFAQRISCYIQRKETGTDIPNDPDIQNPYAADRRQSYGYVPNLESLDNGNVIIIFENSKSNSIDDTLIAARRSWESRWRRLPFYLAYADVDISNDEDMALACTKLILQDMWRGNSQNWDKFLDTSVQHIGILEDKIYEFPADESRADEIWTNSNNWLKTERTMFTHVDTLKEIQLNLRDLADDPNTNDSPWLESNIADLERLQNRIQEDLVKPTANLSDLIYKSVELRDSRHSLELSYSMWRLSWITFLFLPLTFMSGFFGMNVDTFQGEGFPSLQWFFIAAIPLMVLVLISWYVIKHLVSQGRQTPYQRGIYDRLFRDLATAYPKLWSRQGPREAIQPMPSLQRFEWDLIRHWNTPEKTISNSLAAEYDQFDGLSSWDRMKRYLTRRWTAQISSVDRLIARSEVADEGYGDTVKEGLEEVNEMLHVPAQANLPGSKSDGTPVTIKSTTTAETAAPYNLSQRVQMANDINMRRSASPHRQSSPSPSGSSARHSGIIVEEQKMDWLKPAAKT